MFSIKIWNNDRSSQLAKLKKFIRLEFDDVLDNFGTGLFKLDLLSDEADETILKKFNRLSVFDGSTEKWRGYIYNWKINDDFTITIHLGSMLRFLNDKRFITETYTDENVNTVFEDIINTMNSASPTEFTFGGSDITGPPSEDFEFQNTPMLDALKQVARTVAGEIFIDLDDKIYLKGQVGEDKTSTVQFKFLQNKMNENNAKSFNVTDDGDDMVNYVLAKNNEDPPKTSVKSDATSITEFGRLEKPVVFPDITSQDALDSAAQDYLDKRKNPIVIPQIKPNEKKINESLYSIGDLCKIRIAYGFYGLDENYRVVRKKYIVPKDADKAVITLQVGNTSITRDDFFKRIASIEKRVNDLEK